MVARTPEQNAARFDEAVRDADFMAWLKEYYPDWISAYSGEIIGLFDAWCAGMERAEDEFAHRDIPSEDN